MHMNTLTMVDMDVAQFRHAIRIDIKGQLIDFFVEPDLDPLVIDRLLKARKHGWYGVPLYPRTCNGRC